MPRTDPLAHSGLSPSPRRRGLPAPMNQQTGRRPDRIGGQHFAELPPEPQRQGGDQEQPRITKFDVSTRPQQQSAPLGWGGTAPPCEVRRAARGRSLTAPQRSQPSRYAHCAGRWSKNGRGKGEQSYVVRCFRLNRCTRPQSAPARHERSGAGEARFISPSRSLANYDGPKS